MKNKENMQENQLLQQLQKINEGEKQIDLFFSVDFVISMVNFIGWVILRVSHLYIITPSYFKT